MTRATTVALLALLAVLGCAEPSPHGPPDDAAADLADVREDSRRAPPEVAPQPLSAGAHATCVARDQQVWCWGGIDECRLEEAAGEPRRVDGLELVVQVAVGPREACALDRAGVVRCWSLGPFFAATEGPPSPPELVTIPGLDDPLRLSVGSDACVLDRAGKVRCWTFDEGQLRGPDGVHLPAPAVDVTVGPGWFACALIADGTVRCWDTGQWNVTPGETDYAVSASPLDLGIVATRIALSAHGWCAADASGFVECWTDQPDGPDSLFAALPANAPEGAPTSLVGGDDTFCAGWDGGELLCWNESAGPEHTWQPWPGPVEATAVGAGHLCALDADGTTRCRGRNDLGQLGQGGAADRVSVGLADLDLPAGLQRVAAGEALACLLTTGHELRCWGSGVADASPGDPAGAVLPCPEAGAQWSDVSVGGSALDGSFVCGFTDLGSAWCADVVAGGIPESATWTELELARPVRAVALDRGRRGCALTEGGPPLCFALDPAPTIAEATAVGEGYERLDCLFDRCCAIDPAAGTVCFDNPAAAGDRGLHLLVLPELAGSRVTVGAESVCLLRSGGGVACWGFNGRCGLGVDSTMPTVTEPVSVPLPGEALDLAGGDFFHCARLADGRLACWGELDEGCRLELDGLAGSCGVGLFHTLDAGAGMLAAASDHLLLAVPGEPLRRLGRNQWGEVPGAPVPASDLPLAVDFGP